MCATAEDPKTKYYDTFGSEGSGSTVWMNEKPNKHRDEEKRD